MAGLIERTRATKVKTTQYTAGQLHQIRVLLEVITKQRDSLHRICSLMADTKGVAPSRATRDAPAIRWV